MCFNKIGNGKQKGAELIIKTKDAMDVLMVLSNDNDLEHKERGKRQTSHRIQRTSTFQFWVLTW